MATVFISYSRESREKAKSIAADLEALGHEVWFDQELTGGQSWWDRILGEIRACEIFAFALTPESLDSVACKREYNYAARLGKSILPLLASDGVSIPLLPSALAQIQFVDYRSDDRDALRALAKAITSLPASDPLPDPLPEPPPVPVSYLGGLREQIDAPESMTFGQQTELLLRLKNGLRNVKDANEIRTLLKLFRARDDLYAKVADEIDAVLAAAPVQAPIPEAPQSQPTPALNETTVQRAAITPPVKDVPVSGAADRDCMMQPPFKFFSSTGFKLPIIIGISVTAAGIILGLMPPQMLAAGLVGYVLLILVIRLLRWLQNQGIQR